jgi:hypothetical protein
MTATKGTIVSVAALFAALAFIASFAVAPWGPLSVAIVGVFSIGLSVVTVFAGPTGNMELAELKQLRELKLNYEKQHEDLVTAEREAARGKAETAIHENVIQRERELATEAAARVTAVEAEMATLRKDLLTAQGKTKKAELELKSMTAERDDARAQLQLVLNP